MRVNRAPMTYGSERNGSAAFFDAVDNSELSDSQGPKSFELPTEHLTHSWVFFEKFGRLQNSPIGDLVEFAQILEKTSG